MNLPNILSIFRIILIPIFVAIFFSGMQHSLIYSILIFLIAGFTDILDGFIARKYNLITKWGMVLDPLADKLMLLTVLSCLVIEGYAPIWVLIIISLKDLFMIFAGMKLFHKDVVIPANKIGKLTSLLFYISVFVLSFDKALGKLLLYCSVLSALIAFSNYFLYYKKSSSTQQ
ncbi:MAG TPA: CDP-diacylglycerol--glycerol-3-phosphate 3-phosphatidyltransferase [Clostridiaceae bacterium]